MAALESKASDNNEGAVRLVSTVIRLFFSRTLCVLRLGLFISRRFFAFALLFLENVYKHRVFFEADTAPVDFEILDTAGQVSDLVNA